MFLSLKANCIKAKNLKKTFFAVLATMGIRKPRLLSKIPKAKPNLGITPSNKVVLAPWYDKANQNDFPFLDPLEGKAKQAFGKGLP